MLGLPCLTTLLMGKVVRTRAWEEEILKGKGRRYGLRPRLAKPGSRESRWRAQRKQVVASSFAPPLHRVALPTNLRALRARVVGFPFLHLVPVLVGLYYRGDYRHRLQDAFLSK